MNRTQKLQSPQIDEIRWEGLRTGDAGELVPGAELESVAYADLVVEELPFDGGFLDGVRVDGLRADRVDMKAASLAETALHGVDIAVMNAPRSRWRDVLVTGRFGALDANESALRSVHFSHCRLGYVNLRGADLLDVQFTDCRIDELDLGGGKARRVRFDGCTVAMLDVHHARLRDVDLRGADLSGLSGIEDLRGATIDAMQLGLLAPLFAEHLGVVVDDR